MSEGAINDARTGDVVTLHGTRWNVIGFTGTPSVLLEREGCDETPINQRTHHTVCLHSEHASQFKLVDPVMEIFHGITRDDEAMDRHFSAGFIEAIRRLDERGMIDRKHKEAGK